MDKQNLSELSTQKLCGLRDALLHRAQREKIESIVVTGDFATGELSFIMDGSSPILISICRVTVIFSTPLPRKYIRSLAERFFTPIDTLKCSYSILHILDLPLLPRTPDSYELKKSGRIIYGNEGILARIPQFNSDAIPVAHGLRKMFSALISLLQQPSISCDRTDFPATNKLDLIYGCTESLLSCCDALLILKGCFTPFPKDKQEAFMRHYANEQIIQEQLDSVLAFRLDTPHAITENSSRYWFKTKDLILDIILRYFGHFICCTGSQLSLEDICYFMSNIFPLRPEGRLLASGIRLLDSIQLGKIKEDELRGIAVQLGLPPSMESPQELWEKCRIELAEGLKDIISIYHEDGFIIPFSTSRL